MIRSLLLRRTVGYRSNRSSTPLLLSERQLFRELLRERCRADRRQIPFCLIDISFSSSVQAKKEIHRLARALRKRLRITDLAGHRGPVTVGVLLTDTHDNGGRLVFSELKSLLSDLGLICDLELFVYDPNNDKQGWPLENHCDAESLVKPLHPTSAKVGRSRAFMKRTVDIFGASIGLTIAALPVSIAAIAIKANSPGPVIFRQVREGANGKHFTIYKLRTMVHNAERQQSFLLQHNERGGPAFKMKCDPRVTSVGRVLRITCIDELPQLVNVLLGQMSLVGPRPLPLVESRSVEHWQRRRLDVKPGITGIWQTEKHEQVTFDDWMRMDLRYVDHGSIWMDMRLLAKTLLVPLKRRGNS